VRYRRLPLIVSAVRVIGIDHHEVEIEGGGDDTEWLNAALDKGIGEEGGLWVINDGLRIGTLEGTLRVAVGDYIVRGTKGEIYPVRGDIFEDSYVHNGH
jgi:hypothetical protein